MRRLLIAACLVLLSSGALLAAPSTDLVMLDVSSTKELHDVISLIEATGGRARVVYPNVAIIADDVSPAVDSSPFVTMVHREAFDPTPLRSDGNPLTYHAALAWLGMRSPELRPSSNEEPPRPDNDLRTHQRLNPRPELCDQPGTGTAYGVGFCDLDEFMAGTVAVDVIMPESDGSIDPNTEDWTEDEEAEVVTRITTAMDWWVARAVEHNVPLTFFLRFHYRIPTGYEPISNNSITGPTCSGLGDEYLWKNDCLNALGVTEDCMEGEYTLANATRESLQTDWAFQIWAVDSSNDADGKFLDGAFSYAWLGGPSFTIATSKGTYEMHYLDSYGAHETGHIFWALDQYYGGGGCTSVSSCSKTTGYLNIENQNCQQPECEWDENSIMRCTYSAYQSGLLDPYAAGQIGWIDTDADDILDVLDLEPLVALYSHEPDPTNETAISYSGSTHVAAGYPNSNYYHSTYPQIYGPPHDINVNEIGLVEWRVNDGSWSSASASDGLFDAASEQYSFLDDPVAIGTHVYEARAWNTVGNSSAVSASDTLTVVDWVSVPGHGLTGQTRLSAGTPNPFRDVVTFQYTLAQPSAVKVAVYDVSGRLVRVLHPSGVQTPGSHMVSWDGSNESGLRVASGVYVCRLETRSGVRVARVVLIE